MAETDTSYTTTADVQVTDSGGDTPTGQSEVDQPKYDMIPAEKNTTLERSFSPAAPSVTSTFRSDEDYYPLSISTAESVYPYCYTPDMNFTPVLPEYGLPSSIPDSLRSGSGHSFLEMTPISFEEAPSGYMHPLNHSKYYHDMIPPQSNGPATLRPPPPPMHRQVGIQRSRTFASRGRTSRGSTHSHSSAGHHRPLAKSSSSDVPRRPFHHSLDQPRFLHSPRRHGLPPIPPHGVNPTASPSFGSEHTITMGTPMSNSSLSTLIGPSRSYARDLTNPITIASDTNCNDWIMTTGELSGSYQRPTPTELDPDYAEVPEEPGLYDVPTPHDLTGHEAYDVPRKEASA